MVRMFPKLTSKKVEEPVIGFGFYSKACSVSLKHVEAPDGSGYQPSHPRGLWSLPEGGT